MTPEYAWNATLGHLRAQLTRSVYNNWISQTKFSHMEGNVYIIHAHHPNALNWLNYRLKDTILRTLKQVTLIGDVDINFIYVPVPIESKPLIAENKQDRFLFSTFIVGESNSKAYQAAIRTAQNPGRGHNPLFIHGASGLGKTHLLRAMGYEHTRSQLHHQSCYVTSEAFMNELVTAVETDNLPAFYARFQAPTLLLIDDIQFMTTSLTAQETLVALFEKRQQQQKQTAVSCDRLPADLPDLMHALRTRIENGLIVPIHMPDAHTRRAILEAKVEALNLRIPSRLLTQIAVQVRSNIRELEGALNKVAAYAMLSNSPVTEEIVRLALSDMLTDIPQVSLPAIVTAVCNFYKITPEAILCRSRCRTIAFPRQIVMYLARVETDASYIQIGNHLGFRDHSTVLYGYEKISELMEQNESIRRDIIKIRTSLYEPVPN